MHIAFLRQLDVNYAINFVNAQWNKSVWSIVGIKCKSGHLSMWIGVNEVRYKAIERTIPSLINHKRVSRRGRNLAESAGS